jgi:hypothetical protein
MPLGGLEAVGLALEETGGLLEVGEGDGGSTHIEKNLSQHVSVPYFMIVTFFLLSIYI